MTTKEAAKKVLKLYEANAAFLNAVEERGGNLCMDANEIKVAMPDAKKAIEVLLHRFP